MKELILLFFLATCSIVSAKTYYVSTSGKDTNPGTISQPYATWQKGFSVLIAGDTLFIRGGTYFPSGTTYSNHYCGVGQRDHSGTAANPITVWAYPGETPVLDCRNMTQPASHIGIYFENCNYWHLKGLNVTRADQIKGYGAAGIRIHSGNNLKLENITSHHNGGSGIQITQKSENNLLLNCDAYYNYDQYSSPAGEHADGIEIADIVERNGNERVNTMIGCRSWDNSDDGFDHYRAEGILVFDKCWAWHNGFIPGTEIAAGNGEGFKMGITAGTPEKVVQRTLTNCISFNNRTRGFSQNGANVLMKFYNNISYKNDNQGYMFYTYNVADILKNNLSYKNGAHIYSQSNQIIEKNSWQNGLVVSDADFQSLDGSQLTRPRKANGDLPDITFMHLAPGSKLIDAGINVGLPFSGQAPDIGAFETSTISPVVANQPPVVSISSPSKSASFTSPATITVNATASDPDGTIVKVEFFQGNVKIGEKTTSPYSITWNEVPEGTYSLTAAATDNANSKTVSAAVSITVVKPVTPINQSPLVSISSPTKGISFTAPATVTIDVNASDPDGSITKVELFNGAVKLYEKTAAPYSFTLKDLPAGSYELKAVATDNMKAIATSSYHTLTVTPILEARDYFNLYPNPNDGRFSIEFTSLLDADIFTVTVVDLIGKTVYREELSKEESTRQFDLSHLNSGIYVLMIAANQILLTQKFIKG